MGNAHILVVEDEKKLADLLHDYLTGAGYQVSTLDRGDTVVPWVQQHAPALILLDIMLPGLDGTEVCRKIRRFSSVPILMITARVEEIDRVLGLELGADDYIGKPFSPREVVARVKAVLRRSRTDPKSVHLTAGPLSLDEAARQVLVHHDPLNLTPSEFGLLKVLMAHPNRVFSRNELLGKVQGYQFEGYDRTIDSHIKNLRKKIAEKLPGQEVIQSVYGVGYKFVRFTGDNWDVGSVISS
jgi:two-component system response regulator BaeR